MVADTQQSSAHAAHFNSAVYTLGYRIPDETFHGARIALAEELKVTGGPPEQVLVSWAGVAGLSLNSTSILS